MTNDNNIMRLDYLDIARGIAILCVILGHYLIGRLRLVVFSFHIPLFFVISGYLIKPIDFNRLKFYLKKMTVKLLIPYLITCLTVFIFTNDISREFIGEVFLGLNKSSGYYEVNKGIGPLWFCWAYFWSVLIFSLLINYSKNKINLIIACSLLCITGVCISSVDILPWQLDNAMVVLIYLLFGYLMNYFNISKKCNLKTIFYIIFFVVGLLGQQLIGMQSYASRIYPIFPICIILSSFICLSIVHFCECWEDKHFNKKTIFMKILVFAGKNSLFLMCLHTIEYFCFMESLRNIKITGVEIIDTLLHGVISCIINVFIVSIYIKIKNKKRIKCYDQKEY